MKKWLVLFLMATFVLVLAACTASEDAGEDTTDASGEEGTADSGGEKILYMNNAEEPTSFDPSIGFNAVSWSALNNLMEGLTRLDDSSQPVEAAAESIEVSEDELTYTFNIREDANWSNGEPVTAGDFVFAWQHMLNPETASPAAFLAYFIEGAEAYNNGEGAVEDIAISAEDDKTFVVTLTEPTEAFLNILTNPSFFPIHEATATENPDWHTEADSFVGNGPFNLASWSHDEEFVFEKNTEYWDADNVNLDQVHWAMVNDPNTEYQMYEAGELDVSSVPAEMSEQLQDSPELMVMDQAGTYFYRYNVEEEPFTNKKVRQAFAYAVNQDDIVQYVTKNGEKPAYGFVSYGFEGPNGQEFRDEAGELVKFDAEQAKQLLEEGMQEEGWDELPPVTITYSTSESHQNIAETLQDQFKTALDVDVELQNVEASVFLSEQKEFKYQLSRSSFIHDYADPVNALESFITDSSMNRTQWSNEEFDQLIAEAKAETDSATRWETLIEAEKVLMDEMPIFPIHFYNQVQLQKEGVEGILRHPVGYIDLKNADKN